MDIDIKSELEIQKEIAYTAGILQGDITIKILFESIAEGVVIINKLGRIILINSRFEEMSGYSKMEVMGSDINIFMNSGKHHAHSNHLKHFFANPRIRPMGVGLELTVLTKDKKSIPVEISISFIDTETGRLGIAFITDNTARKKAIDALTQRNIELDAYAHTVAHDLKASLSGIRGFSELLLSGENEIDDKKRKEYIKIIANSSKKMNDVIHELLLFASIDKVEINLNYFDMKHVLSEACNRLSYQISQSGATIEIDENMIDCESYSSWIEEIWLNYISNAVKYAGEAPVIKITSEKTNDGFIKYSVIDNGPGIDKDTKETIFNDDFRKSSKGSGLGLSIVKRIVEKLDGYATVESEINKGCNFSFYIKDK